MRDSLKNSDFKRILKEGQRISGAIGSAIVLKGRGGKSRLGAIVSSKVGNAVKRNRIRRIFQEAFRAAGKNLKQNLDIVIIPRHRAVDSSFWDAKEFMAQIVRRFNG